MLGEERTRGVSEQATINTSLEGKAKLNKLKQRERRIKKIS